MQGTENRTNQEKKSPGQVKKIPRRDSAPYICIERERENPLNGPVARFEPTKIGYVSDLCSERAGQESQIGSLFMTLGRIVVVVSCEL